MTYELFKKAIIIGLVLKYPQKDSADIPCIFIREIRTFEVQPAVL